MCRGTFVVQKMMMMSVKKTIAIVGATETNGTEIARQLAKADYRLLLISNDISKLGQLATSIEHYGTETEIDFIECVKDGCWEADIIILSVPFSEEKEVAEMIKEVATQKIVVSISNEKSPHKELQQILPYSRLINVSLAVHSKEILILGNDEEAEEEIADIFESAGYIVTKAHHFSESK
jgi:predicted dinucleotide-binding enzyme